MCSEDYGSTWTRKGQILTAGTKPETPRFAGIGDFGIVWDWQNGRWFMVTSKMRGAVSYHRGAAGQSFLTL